MDEKELYVIKNNNNLIRYITMRSYFYIFRRKENGDYHTFYKPSPLLEEIINVYYSLPKDKRSTYVEKHTRKAE